MSDLDTLVVTFQTQLSDVMETVVKTAMYEVTRLVENGFLQEMKRRNQEVESLRIQLQWAERKLNDQEGKDDDMEPCSDTTEPRPKEQQDGKARKTVVLSNKQYLYNFTNKVLIFQTICLTVM